MKTMTLNPFTAEGLVREIAKHKDLVKTRKGIRFLAMVLEHEFNITIDTTPIEIDTGVEYCSQNYTHPEGMTHYTRERYQFYENGYLVANGWIEFKFFKWHNLMEQPRRANRMYLVRGEKPQDKPWSALSYNRF